MANQISRILMKRSAIASHAPLAEDLQFGELSLNYNDKRLYFLDSNSEISFFDANAIGSEGGTVNGDLTVKGNLTATASKAVADASGNTITTTYATKNELDGKADSVHNHELTQINGLDTALSGKLDVTGKAESAKVADSVAWGGISGKPTAFAPEAHNQASNTITAMTGYVKAETASAVAATDSLNVAIGKLERSLEGKLSTTGTAAKATADSNGNIIVATYAKQSEFTELQTEVSEKHEELTEAVELLQNNKLDVTVYGTDKASFALKTDLSGKLDVTGKAESAKVADSVAWDNVSGKPTSFTPSSHNQASNTINALTGYTKPNATSALATSDTLNGALGKLEKALDAKVSTSGGTVSGNLTVNGTLTATATKANALTVNEGSVTQPIYFANGVPVKTTHSLNATVPADAKFTDTTYSTGTDTVSGLTKLYVSTGTAEDGTMTQEAITNELAKKLESDDLTSTLADYVTEERVEFLEDTIRTINVTTTNKFVSIEETLESKLDATANAVSASAWVTGRKITLGGDASGNVTIDGSKDVTLTVTVADDSHAHVIGNVDGLQSALDAKASLASPALTGTPTAPTATAGTNTTQIATTAFVTTAVANKTSVASATKATQDGSGNVITETYLTKASASDLYLPVEGKAASATVADSANAVAWGNVSGKPTAFVPEAHNQASNTINVLTGYSKPSTTSALTTSDTLNSALGKLEKALDSKMSTGTNATTASAWATGRKITLSGDASGNVTIDGSKDVTLTVTVADDSHAHVISNIDGLQSALDAKASTASVESALATAKGYTDTEVAKLVGSAPETLNTLGEIASALDANEDVVDALNEAIGSKANASDVVKLTGNQTIAGTKTFSSTITGSISGNAGSATKATQDASGNVITTTYATKTEMSDKVSKQGDTVNGQLVFTTSDVIRRDDHYSCVEICGGTSSADGARIVLTGEGDSDKGAWKLDARDTSGDGHWSRLMATADGKLTFQDKNLVRSINGVDADIDGNVAIGNASTTNGGLMSASDKSKLDGIASGANAYVHPSHTAKTSGFYKVTVDALGHVSATTAVTKADITGLGIPSQDTVYTHPSTHAASMITGLATVATSGKYSDLTGVPSSLPANGGNADTVGGFSVGTNVPSNAKFTDTVYTLPTASSSTLGGVKTTSTVTSTSGLTACPIISGVPYYKDTTNTYTLSSFGITATAAELNVLDGITATVTELNYVDGVTSNIQTQLNGKLATNGKAASATVADSANAVAWGNVSGKPTSFTPSSHNQASNTINALTGYAKASSASALATSDTLNGALGKLEKALDGKLATTGTAAKATADASGNTITTTYATKTEVSNLGDAIVDGFEEFSGAIALAYASNEALNALEVRVASLETRMTDVESLIEGFADTYVSKADYQAQIDSAYEQLNS